MPDSDEKAQKIIEDAASSDQGQRMTGKFNFLLQVKRTNGKTDREIALELWNVPYVIAQFRQESKEHGCQKELDHWLASQARTRLDVELAEDLISAKQRIWRAVEFAQEHGQEHVFQAFIDEARAQKKPDVVLVSELTLNGVPPWKPPVPNPKAPCNDEEIDATINEAKRASAYRGMETEFDKWINKVKAKYNLTPRQIARALWNAAYVIREVMAASAASAANGTGEQLHRWLVSKASTKLDVQLAAKLTRATETLARARIAARESGYESRFQSFTNKMERRGKPDVVIVSELPPNRTPPWMPDWKAPVPERLPPKNAEEAQALIEKTEAACESRWVGSQFKDWVRVRKIRGDSDSEIAYALWAAPHIIREIRNGNKANGCLKKLDQWLVSQAKTKIDVELAAMMSTADAGVKKARVLAQAADREKAFKMFVYKARWWYGKPDVIIFEEWAEIHNNARHAETIKPTNHEAIEQHPKQAMKTAPLDADATPSEWTAPAPPPESPPSTEDEFRATIREAMYVHKKRWLEEEFGEWLDGKKDIELIAHALWEVARTIHKARVDSKADGCLYELDKWFALAAGTMTDIDLASALTQAKPGLQHAREVAQTNGQEEVLQEFIDAARRQKKPDVVILHEWTERAAQEQLNLSPG